MDLMPLGHYFTYPGGGSVYAPDWNDPDYIARADALAQAVASRYANDPGFGWIEIGPYGDWGEWHVYQWPYPYSNGAQDMTVANRKHIIDTYTQVFPANKLVQMVGSANGSNATMAYAMAKSPLIGVRGDCFGDSLFDTRMVQLDAVAPNRWHTAPILAEYCGGGTGEYTMGLAQVQSHHVAMIGGNFGSYSSHSTQEQHDFDQTRKLAGFRFALDQVQRPQAISRGSTFALSSSWKNLGVAPAHEAWDVAFELRADATVVWVGRSSINLRTFLPGTASFTDSFTVPTSVATGTYTLHVIVRDPTGYYHPMQLSTSGRASDGSYLIDQITVR
jgi:hypothetical protein